MASAMPQEEHGTGGRTVRDVIIGMSDGLTVPFALAAGLSGAVGSSFVVLVAGVSEMAAGAIAMGLGGYLAARSELDTYRTELERERREVREIPEAEIDEVRGVFASYGLQGQALDSAVAAIVAEPQRWLQFMMREELRLEEPAPGEARRSAVTIGLAYVAGGVIPLAPYALGLPLTTAFMASVAVTLVALVIFGALKGRLTGVPARRAALETLLTGGAAAGVAYALARGVSSLGAP